MKILLLILFVVSCSYQKENMYSDLFSRWIYGQEILILNQTYVNSGQEITSPPNTWQKLLSVKIGFEQDCLYYKLPHRNSSGVLSITTIDNNSQCTDFPNENNKLILKDISNLLVKVSDNSDIMISFESFNKHVNWDFSLVNVTNRTTKGFDLFDSSVTKKRYGSFQIFSEIIVHKENKLLIDGTICRLTDEKCNLQFDICHQCQNGSYDGVNYRCSLNSLKICGHNRCGEKDQAACPRGEQFSQLDETNLCYENSPSGFCSPGLQVSCGANNYLICI